MNSFIVLDIETTGINPQESKITEIGAIKVINNKVIESYSQLINPEVEIPSQIVSLTGITDEMVRDKPIIHEVIQEFIDFCDEKLPIVGHNIMFDYSFIKYNALNKGLKFEREALDTLSISRKLLKDLESRKLGFLCNYFGIEHSNAHRALDDALVTHKLLKCLEDKFYLNNSQLFVPKKIHWKPKKIESITEKQKKFLVSLMTQHNLQMDEKIEDLTKSQASKKIDQIIFKHGRRL